MPCGHTLVFWPTCFVWVVGAAACSAPTGPRSGLPLTLGIHVNCPYGLPG